MNLVAATVIRAVMMIVGAATGQDGWQNEDTIQAITGGVVAALGLLWGLYEKYKLSRVGITRVPLTEPKSRE